MGIPGLKGFMNCNRSILTDHRLYQTKLVIDGNNLYHYLFNSYNVDSSHGGDYFEYALNIRKFFTMLHECLVKPFVIFDGGHDPDDLKLKRRIRKAEQCVSNVRKFSSVPPLLMYETFRFVLLSMEVPFAVCDFEADQEAANLANDFHCPLLSNDSDFYIFQLKAGFIPLDTLDNRIQGNETKPYLACKVYFNDTITRFYPRLGHDALLLIGTFSGNDIIDKDLFERFYMSLPLPSYKNLLPLTFTRKYHDMCKLLYWLTTVQNMSSAINTVIQSLKPEFRKQVETEIRNSINQYQLNSTSFSKRLYTFFEVKEALASETMMRSTWQRGLPDWFVDAHRKGLISMVFQNIIVHKRNIFTTQVEDLGQPSSFFCSAPLREYLYGILTCESEENITVITEIDRRGHTIDKFMRKCFKEVPKLSEIPSLQINVRREMILKVLGFHLAETDLVEEDMILPLAVLQYYYGHTEPKIDINHIKAILGCILALGIRQVMEQADVFGISSIQMLIKRQKIKHSCALKLFRNSHARDGTDITILHAFAQFQGCIMAAIDLNQVMLCPFPPLNPANFIYGTILYCLYYKLRSHPDGVIDELLNHDPLLLKLFHNMLYLVVEMSPAASNK